ncbi:MAG: MFS transporter [Candidatus Palauibacterales bacterium]|nr:MFS transporter [Candidatus Palauibacterales bacterium]
MKTERTRLNRQEWWAVGTLSGVFFLRMLGIFLVLPVLGPYASKLQGATPLLVGLAYGAFPLLQTAFQVPFGWMSDHIGRKPMIALALGLFTAGSVWAAFAHSIWMLIGAMALQGSGAVAAVILALVADLTRPEVRTRSMAMIGSSIGLAFGVGFVGGPLVAAHLGVPWIFGLLAVVTPIALLVVLFVVPTPGEEPHHDELGASASGFREVITNPDLLRMDSGIFVLNGTLRGLFLVAPFLLSTLVQPQHEWLVYLGALLIAGVVMVPTIIFAERDGYMKEALYLSLLSLGAGLLLFTGGGRGIAWFFVAISLYFVGFSLLEAIMPSLLTRLAPDTDRGKATGVYNMSQYLGSFGGALLGSAFLSGDRAEAIGVGSHYGLLFLVLTAGVAVWAWIAWKLPMPTRRQAAAHGAVVEEES